MIPLARIARIVVYVVDPYDDSPISDEVVRLIQRHDNELFVASIRSEEKDFEWDPYSIINDVNATELDVAKFFRELESDNV